MGQDKYIKVTLTVIAFSLFWIALNLSVLEFVLYDFYSGGMEKLFSAMSNETQKISSQIVEIGIINRNELFSRIDEISSRIDEFTSQTDELIDAIKRR